MSDSARFVGNMPKHYDEGLGPVIFVDYAADTARRVAAWQPARVLEIAAGTGIVTQALRERLPADTHITATDLNQPMLDVAAGKFHTGDNVGFQPADAQALPFADGSFDAVVCQFGVMFFPDKDKANREAARVLAPGGHYLLSIWDGHAYNVYGRIAHEVLGGFFPANPPQFYQVPFGTRFDPVKDSLVAAGFADIEAAVVRRMKDIPDVELFARGLVYGNPAAEEVRTRGGDPAKIVAAMVKALHREFGDPARMPLQAITFTARKP